MTAEAPSARASHRGEPRDVLPRPTGLDIVVLPDASWDRSLWTNRQHVMLRLAEHEGARVLYVAPPRLWVRRFRERGPRLSLWTTQVRDRLWVVQPYLPLPNKLLRRIAPRLVDWLTFAVTRRAARRLGFSAPCLWTYTPLYEPHVGSFNERLLIYDVVDDYSAMAHYQRLIGPSLPDLDRRLTERADLVFAATQAFLEQRSPLNPKCHLVSNAGDVLLYSTARSGMPEPDDLRDLSRPRIGFHGTLRGDKMNVGLLAKVAAQRPEWTFVLIGPELDGECRRLLGTMPNVHFLGSRAPDELPAYLAAFDVLLIPYYLRPFTGRPLKAYEAAAAGVPVVATDLPELDGVPGVTAIPGSAESVVATVASVLEREREDAPLEALYEYSWEYKAHRQRLLIEQALATAAET
jgi:glycosyltransferase involved in cell wall biosynthesis